MRFWALRLVRKGTFKPAALSSAILVSSDANRAQAYISTLLSSAVARKEKMYFCLRSITIGHGPLLQALDYSASASLPWTKVLLRWRVSLKSVLD